MELSSFSHQVHTENIRSDYRPSGSPAGRENREELVQELHVHRVELEVQNRALREMEAEVEAALQRYSDLYDHLPIGYITLTPKGCIVQANPAAAEWLHRDRASLVGGYLNWFLDAFDSGRFAAHLEACVETAQEQTLEVTLRLESGLLLTAQLISRLAPPAGELERTTHTAITHVSKLKQAHTVAADIDQEQETVTASIAQHLHTPITTVSTFARTMLQNHGDEMTVELKEMIERMECAAVRMEGTLQHLLEYCCLGHEKVALDPVNLEELMQQVIVEHRATIQRYHSEIMVDRPLPCVRGARLLLAQVLANILTNILKHGTLERAPQIRISAERLGKEVVLTIREDSTREKADDEDYRVFERRHEEDCYWGTGIGLAIVRGTVERMHGRAWVESEVGKPTIFRLGLLSV